MSLLHTVESVPSRVRGLFSYLLTLEGGIAQGDLVRTLSPQILHDNQQCARKTIEEAQELELIEINQDKIVTLHTELQVDERDPKNRSLASEMLPSIITRLAFTNPNNINNYNLGQAIAWVLTRSLFDKPLDWNQAENELGKGPSLGLNDVRFGNLAHWITYLGFARGEKTTLVADPTIAVRRGLKTVLSDQSTKDLSTVIQNLANKLSVIDGGNHNVDLLKKNPNLAAVDGQVSPSLSIALLRLKEEGFIKLEHRSDSPAPKTLRIADFEETYTSIQRIKF